MLGDVENFDYLKKSFGCKMNWSSWSHKIIVFMKTYLIDFLLYGPTNPNSWLFQNC
jgi:hypothetical protein